MICADCRLAAGASGGLARSARGAPEQQQPEPGITVAALGYLPRSRIEHGLIPLEELLLVVLYGKPDQPGRWLAGYSGQRVPWGVAWGGAKRNQFVKDLNLPPKIGGRSARLDLRLAPLVELAFELRERVEHYQSQCLLPDQKGVALPELWAGFERARVKRLTGSGPELAAQSQRSGTPPHELLSAARLSHRGLVLHPLDWVSHRWRDVACVFADLRRFCKRQIFQLGDPAKDLMGYCGAAEFDFRSTRFQPRGFPFCR